MALNRFVGMGRITATPELKQTVTGTSVVSFTIAIDRNSQEEKATDFINCVAWRQTAEFICRYFPKGKMICVEGSIQVRTYKTQSGETRTATEVVVDRAHFAGDKAAETPKNNATYATSISLDAASFEELALDTDLPF